MADNRKRKRHRWIAVLSIAVILFGIIGVAAYSQRDNILAVMYVKKYTADERQKMLEKNDEAVLKILEKLPDVNVKPLPKEAEEMLSKGDLSEEAAMDIILGNVQFGEVIPENSAENSSAAGNTGSSAETAGNTAAENEGSAADSLPAEVTENNQDGQASESRLNQLIAQVYLLKSSFSGRIDSLIEQAKAEYIANNCQNKAGIAGKYLRKGTDMEAECDARMESLLAEISSELQKTGGDSSIVSEIRSAYKNEKSIKKAELVAEYS